ncbi:hypothetical protein LEM8419_03395 [Neolewinella maritima]|uniref:Uncharacterized protein n=1 Tax=Neolewinella maritima TaxID=1383882 RepID=A0ABM9B550_9BACT|nr:hypothetical protein [Neolewinella maritima]CAH1002516.1 hypothetical protein LEM8419_03395 [Neolewinella maritima]
MATTAQLDATIDSLDQGLQQAKSGASSNISSWVDTLNGTNDPALQTLASELRDLEKMLSSSNPDGKKLREALDSIGQHTTAMASKASGSEADKIRQLGKQLTDAANTI